LHYKVRPYRPGDEEALLAFHNRAFAGHAPRSRRHWDWKFRENPVGTTEIVLAEGEHGRPVAVYAVVSHRAQLDSEACRAGLQTDLAVDSELRTGLGGSRLIVEIGETYQACFLADDVRLEWGFPEPELQRVCLRHLKVGVLRDVVFLGREPGPLPENGTSVEVRACARFGAEVDELWRKCRGELGTCTLRDQRHLNWRYADHPDVTYTLLEARASHGSALRGIAVLRAGGFHAGVVSLLDWLVPRDDHDAEHALVARALEETARERKQFLLAWFPTPWPLFLRFQLEYGFFARSSPFQECYRSRESAYDRRWLDEHWYQTLGDFDSF
jgi:hypothetical protein